MTPLFLSDITLLLQERLQELESQMALKEKELQRLKTELGAIDSDRARTEEEKKRMRAAFEEKAEAVRRQMLQLQKQLKDGEAAKASFFLSLTTHARRTQLAQIGMH